MDNFKILLPKVDIIFKLLFGDKRNSEILIDFLKAVLTIEENEYDSITFDDTHLKPETIHDKLSVVDVRLTTKSGKILHIEIQVLPQNEMPERVTYYNAKMLVTQIKAGEHYNQLQKTISIVITDHEIIKDSQEYHHVFQLYDKRGNTKFTDLIEINTLELTKIPSIADDTKLYDWLRFLKAEREEEFTMAAQNNPVINKAYVQLRRLSQDEQAQLDFDNREKALRDEYARTRYAELKGIQQGMQQGMQQGIQQGIQQGMQQGMQQGAMNTKCDIAKSLLVSGDSLEKISKITGLSIDEIRKIPM